MELELHIDIYSIVTVHASSILFLYQLAGPINRIQDERVKNELTKILTSYSGLMGAGDIIVWPVLITAVYPIYALIRLIFRRRLVLIARTFLQDMELLRITLFVLFLWVISTLAALLHLWIVYAILFSMGLIVLRHLYRRNKKLRAN